MSVELRHEGRQSLSMSHIELLLVPDGRTSEGNECPPPLELKLLCLFGITDDLQIIGRRNGQYITISAGVYILQESRTCGTVRRSRSANDHFVADICSNLVFYSAFYSQPLQIHKKEAS